MAATRLEVTAALAATAAEAATLMAATRLAVMAVMDF